MVLSITTFRRWRYSPLLEGDGDIDDEERELKSTEEPPHTTEALYYGHTFTYWITIVNAFFFALSVWIFLMATLSTRVFSMSPNESNYFLKQVSEPSPILDLIDIPMQTVRMNGTFLETNPPSIFRQPPSPEVDAAWARLESQRPIPISREDVLAQGKDPERAAKFPESFGFGPDAYIGRIDVFHQIHCLNRLRMHLKDNYDYYYADTETNNKYHQLHVSHCVYMLLQNLMCTANVDIYTHTWVDAQENAFPDFSLNHKCRDFGAVMRYHDEHSVPIEEFGAIRRPPDFEPYIMTHEFKQVFEWYDDYPDDVSVGQDIF